jgi:hypothetical protein
VINQNKPIKKENAVSCGGTPDVGQGMEKRLIP